MRALLDTNPGLNVRYVPRELPSLKPLWCPGCFNNIASLARIAVAPDPLCSPAFTLTGELCP